MHWNKNATCFHSVACHHDKETLFEPGFGSISKIYNASTHKSVEK